MHFFEFKLQTKLITFASKDRGTSPTSTNDPSRGNLLPGYGFPTQQFWVDSDGNNLLFRAGKKGWIREVTARHIKIV